MKYGGVTVRAAMLLQDMDGVRWSAAEQQLWINDGIKAICTARPDAHTENVELTLIAGAKQRINLLQARLLDITNNVVIDGEAHNAGRSITITDREEMDRFDPAWRQARPSKTVKQFMHDSNDQRTFYVTPPNDGTGVVNAVCATMPEESIVLDEELPLDDRWFDALVYYVCMRCYQYDGEFVPRATEFRQLFIQQLTGEYQATKSSQPNVTKAGGKPDLLSQSLGGV